LMAPLLGILHGMVEGGRNLDPSVNPFLTRLGSKDYTWPMEAVSHMLRGGVTAPPPTTSGGTTSAPTAIRWVELNRNVPWDKCRGFLITPSHVVVVVVAPRGTTSAPTAIRWVELNRNVPWDKCRGFLITPSHVVAPPVEVALRKISENVATRSSKTSGSHHSGGGGGGNGSSGRHNHAVEDDDGQVEEGTCLICMIRDADTSFSPCGHVSCMDCINRHISSGSGKCFWCNVTVTGLRPVSVVLQSAA
ncbi:zinc finger protein, putative, partial [Bodo saltans]